MKPQDLRIGNYISYENTTHIVSGIINNKIYSWWVKDGKPVIEYEQKDIGGAQVENPYIDVVSRYEPIPLTEELLLKVGFKTDSFNNYFKQNLAIDFETLYISVFENEDWVEITITCEYLHQLQNLYYALTKEELTIK
jgi:hypothetical protein